MCESPRTKAAIWVMLCRSSLNSRFGWEFWQEQTAQSTWMTRKERISPTQQPSIFTSILAVLQNTQGPMTSECVSQANMCWRAGCSTKQGMEDCTWVSQEFSHSFFMHFGVLFIPFRGETIKKYKTESKNGLQRLHQTSLTVRTKKFNSIDHGISFFFFLICSWELKLHLSACFDHVR